MKYLGWVVAAAACGGSPAPTGPVSVTVDRDGHAVPGARVHFQDVDSALVATLETDATGTAQADMAAGGFVTVVDPYDVAVFGHRWYTVAGVELGDHLVVHDVPPPVPTIALRLSFPASTPDTLYAVQTSCDSRLLEQSRFGQVASGTLELYDCALTTIDVAISALDPTGAMVRGMLVARDVPVAEGGHVSVEGAFAPAVLVTLDFKQVPSGTTSITARLGAITERGPFFSATAMVPIAGNHGSTTVVMPPGDLAFVEETHLAPGTIGDRLLLTWGTSLPSRIEQVVPAVLPDLVPDLHFDPARHAIAWTPQVGAPGDLSWAQLVDMRSEPGEPPPQWTWSIAAPYTEGVVQLPVVPGDTRSATAVINFFTNAVEPGGYAQSLREHAFARPAPVNFLSGPSGEGSTLGTGWR